MVFKSRWTIDIPDCSLPTFIFGGPNTPVSKDGKIYIDAKNPDTHYLSAHDVRLWSQRLAAGLRKSGVQDGDRILLFSSNHIFYPVAFLGIIMAGGIFTGANPTYTARELAYQLKDSGARYLLCADEAIDTGLEAAKSIGMGKENIFIVNADLYEGKGSPVKGCKYWSELFAPAVEGSRFAWDDLRSPGACHKTLALNYSSGTTGPPKGVEITHRNYVANIMQGTVRTRQPSAPTGNNRVLSALPLYHAMGQVGTIGVALSIGAEVYMMPKFNFEEYLRNIERFRIGQMVLVPPMAVALTRSPFLKKIDLSSIERVNCGAAPLGLEVTREVEALFGHRLFLRQGWGLSE
ncbi:hypothetical protein KEM55_008148 [Ascosphaera atra]|nr:hypothetical protein KEM55_008148 [Ascosphaera atra]